jgi:hypothetical protein
MQFMVRIYIVAFEFQRHVPESDVHARLECKESSF